MPDYTAPFSIVVGVAEVWIAPVGESFPAVDATPSGNWISLGSTNDDGVAVTHQRETEIHFKGNSVLPQKASLSETQERISMAFVELSVERYSKLLDDASVSTVAAGSGTAGYKLFNLAPDLNQYALLIRGPSPVMNAYAQYEYARVSPIGDRELQYQKVDKTELPVEFAAFEDTSNPGRFGQYRAQTATAL